MSPQNSYYHSLGNRRPESRLSPKREPIDEEEEERKLRVRKRWQIEQERERLHEERKKRLIEEYNRKKHLMKEHHRRTSGSRKEVKPRQNSGRPADTPPTREGIIAEIAGCIQQMLFQGGGSSSGTVPNAIPIQPPPIPSTSHRSRSPRQSYRREDGSPQRWRSRERPVEAQTRPRSTSQTRPRSRSPRDRGLRERRDRTRSRSRDRRRRSPRPHRSRESDRPTPRGEGVRRIEKEMGHCRHMDRRPPYATPCRDLRDCTHAEDCPCRFCKRCKTYECSGVHGRPISRPPPRPERRAPEPVRSPPHRSPSPAESFLPDYLPRVLPGRKYIFFQLGPLGAHYVDTERDGPLHNWWREHYMVTPHPVNAPVDIPFLRSSFTIPADPRPLRLADGSLWWPPRRPSRNPHYYRGPPPPRPPLPPPPRYM